MPDPPLARFRVPSSTSRHLLATPATIPRPGRCRVLQVLNGQVVTRGDLDVVAATANRVRVDAACAAQLHGLQGAGLLPHGVGLDTQLSTRGKRSDAVASLLTTQASTTGAQSSERRVFSSTVSIADRLRSRRRPASAPQSRTAPIARSGADVSGLHGTAPSSVAARPKPRPGQTLSAHIQARQVKQAAIRDKQEQKQAVAERVTAFLKAPEADRPLRQRTVTDSPKKSDAHGVADAGNKSGSTSGNQHEQGRLSTATPSRQSDVPRPLPRSAAHIASSHKEFEVGAACCSFCCCGTTEHLAARGSSGVFENCTAVRNG